MEFACPKPPDMKRKDMSKSKVAQNNLMGAMFMVLSGISFVGVYVTVRYLGTRLPAAEAAWLRYVLGLVFLIPVAGRLVKEKISKDFLKLSIWRGVVHVGGVTLWFFAMARLPVAEVTAMGYLTPVFVAIGAVIFLGERFALRRAMAIVIAVIGVLIILRPGFRAIEPAHMSMVLTTMCFGASYLVAKQMSGQASTDMVVAQLSIWVSIFLTPLAVINWVTPTLFECGLLFLTAAFATAGHYLMTAAFKRAPISFVQPFTFLQLVWSVLVGYLLLGEGIDGFVILGGLIIVAAVIYITLREARVKAEQGKASS